MYEVNRHKCKKLAGWVHNWEGDIAQMTKSHPTIIHMVKKYHGVVVRT